MRHPGNQLAVISVAMYATSFFLRATLGDDSSGWALCWTCLMHPLGWLAQVPNALFVWGVTDAARGRWRSVRWKGLIALLMVAFPVALVWPYIAVGYVLWLTSMLMLSLAGHQGL